MSYAVEVRGRKCIDGNQERGVSVLGRMMFEEGVYISSSFGIELGLGANPSHATVGPNSEHHASGILIQLKTFS